MNRLVSGLDKEILDVNSPVEIVLIDDSSDPFFIEKNEAICSRHTYIKLNDNIGRSRIRNLFLDYVSYEYMLFLDCDATLISDKLISNYIAYILKNNPQVVCGGSSYPTNKVERNYRLRWKNGNVRETRNAHLRCFNPYGSFMTSNVIIRKDVFNEVSFDKSLSGYGHEDTLFGFNLKQKQIPISHIDNYVLNDDLDENSTFVAKMESAIENLCFITEQLQYDNSFIEDNRMLKMYFKLNHIGIIIFVRIFFFILGKSLRLFLVSGYAPLVCFDIYKLGYLTRSFQLQKGKKM